jgi:hypothetical protein
MRFLVLFREVTGMSGDLRERTDYLAELAQRGNVLGWATIDQAEGGAAGVAAIFDAASEEDLRQLVAASLARQPCPVDTIRLCDGSDFPVTFGKQKGALAAWEKVMAARRP